MPVQWALFAFTAGGRATAPGVARSGKRRVELQLVVRGRSRGKVGKGVLCCHVTLGAETMSGERKWSFKFVSKDHDQGLSRGKEPLSLIGG